MNMRWMQAGFFGYWEASWHLRLPKAASAMRTFGTNAMIHLLDNSPTLEAGPIPVVDSGLESDAYPMCADRPVGDCVGSNDFMCGFEKMDENHGAELPNDTTGCKSPTGGSEVKMAGNGCVSEIRMDKPTDDMIACLVAHLRRRALPVQ